MDSKTPRKLLAEMLEDLTKENFQKFVHDLVDRRREEPRVRRSRVEEKSYLVVADVMVSTFTEKKAPSVAAEILRGIGCTEEAQQLCKKFRCVVWRRNKQVFAQERERNEGKLKE